MDITGGGWVAGPVGGWVAGRLGGGAKRLVPDRATQVPVRATHRPSAPRLILNAPPAVKAQTNPALVKMLVF